MTVKRLKSLSMTKPIAHERSDSGKWTHEAKLDGLLAHGHRMIYLVNPLFMFSPYLCLLKTILSFGVPCGEADGAMR